MILKLIQLLNGAKGFKREGDFPGRESFLGMNGLLEKKIESIKLLQNFLQFIYGEKRFIDLLLENASLNFAMNFLQIF